MYKQLSNQQQGNRERRLCHGHSLGVGKIDLGTVDLSVKEEGVSSQNARSEEEDNGKGGRATGATAGFGDLSCGTFHVGEDVVDEVAARGVRVVVVDVAQARFAPGSSFVRLLANLGDFVVIVVVVVIIVVVVVVIVLINLLARHALVNINDGFVLERQALSVVEGLVDTRAGLGGAASIGENSHVDGLSVLCGTSESHPVLAVFVDLVVVVVVRVVVVVVAVLVVVVIAVCALQLCRNEKRRN